MAISAFQLSDCHTCRAQRPWSLTSSTKSLGPSTHSASAELSFCEVFTSWGPPPKMTQPWLGTSTSPAQEIGCRRSEI